MYDLNETAELSKKASKQLTRLSSDDKNKILICCAKALRENCDKIILSNKTDLKNAEMNNIKPSLIDRLTLNDKRIDSMAEGLEQIAALDDPIGEVLSMKTLPNGLVVGQKRVAMGVIGIIYESRPNVTSDAFGLCLKAGSAVILRGGKDAINSNIKIVEILRAAINELGFDQNVIQLVTDTSRDSAMKMMKMNGLIDLLIPRGGAGLIRSVVENSTVPVIETGVGNCHIFVDSSAKLQDALNIVINAKTQRPGVCNAAESLLIHKDIAEDFVPTVCGALREKGVEIRADEKTAALFNDVVKAQESDWGCEYLDNIISVKIVENLEDAIEHISKYSTGHSEAIITENYTNAGIFINEIDSAAVYVNASTRFTDGNEFGLGAEIGISTQKLHARGPMGLKEITTTKYIIFGNGQIRK